MKVMVYHGNDGIDIEYIFRKHASASDVMIVSFPGAHGAIGNAGMWGYMLTLNKCNANVLFVRSNEEFSKSRMTFRNRKPIIESAVISLVQKCAKACNAKRIIAIGSSMGGFCALYYGLKYDWDIVAGSPPYTFLSDRSVQYATGGSGEEEKAWINEQMPILMERAGNRGYQKKLFLIFGEGEPFWCSEEHGKKLISDLNASNLPYECKLYPFAVHATIHSLFPSVLEGILDHQFHIVEGNAKKDVEALPPSIRVEVAWEAGCVAFLSSLDQMDPSKEPYFPIKAYKHYGTKDPWTALRNFVYAQNGWLWVKNEVHPRKVKNADFWASAISLDKTSAIGFLLQDGILNYCERHEDSDAMLEWCMETTKEYLLRDPQWGHYTSTFYRIHYFIALHQWMKRKDRKEEWEEKISRDIVANLKHLSLRRGVMSLLWKYRFVLLLLHVALYYSKDEEFFQKAYSSALEILEARVGFDFDARGLCVSGQVEQQVTLCSEMDSMMRFLEENPFPEHATLKKLKRRYQKIAEVTSHVASPDGLLAPLGASIARKSPYLIGRRVPGNLILSESNIAFLEDAASTSYITVNGGSNIHSDVRHCDLLSFTWFYDGHRIFLDPGSGIERCLEYAASSIAHTAFICEGMEYTAPSYEDWTTFQTVDEKENYVSISMVHYLLEGVEMKRKLVWIKPNILLLVDEGISKTEHAYTQNFMMHDVGVDRKDPNQVIVKISPRLYGVIRQYPQGDGFVLREFHGTSNIDDEAHFRGSLIERRSQLCKGLNLAYTKTGKGTVRFMTSIELHSANREGKKEELAVQFLHYDENGNYEIKCKKHN